VARLTCFAQRDAGDQAEARTRRPSAAVPLLHCQGEACRRPKRPCRARARKAPVMRGDLSEGERAQKFAGHSLRAGLASSAKVDERHVQRQLGHASAEMTRKYQRRRDRFRVNLTKAGGL